jgi:hypothetical protein
MGMKARVCEDPARRVTPPDESGVDHNLLLSLVVLLFFTAALFFFTLSWWTRDPRLCRQAIVYCAIFWVAGWAMVLAWLITVA